MPLEQRTSPFYPFQHAQTHRNKLIFTYLSLPVKTYTTILLLYCYVSSFAQTIVPQFESLTINNGLPHSSVYSILQDKKGFMWFGTPDGLCRYDGRVLTSYKYQPANKKEVANNFVRGKIHEDEGGNIWYSNETGIFKWDALKQQVSADMTFTRDTYQNIQFMGIELDSQGSIWMVALPNGLARYDIKSKKLQFFPFHISGINFSAALGFAVVDRSNNIWIRVNGNNDYFLKFDKRTATYTRQSIIDPPHALFFDHEKEVHLFSNKIIFKYYKSNKEVVIPKTINGKQVDFFSFDATPDSHGRIWMTARGNGLFDYNGRQGNFHEYRHSNSRLKSLAFDLTTCLFIDRSDNLWVGLDGGGVARLDLKPPRFNLFPLSEGDYPVLQDYFTKCFYEDDKKRIWFGTHNSGLNIYDPSTSVLVNYKNDPLRTGTLPGNSVAGIYKDSKQNIWIATNAGIALFDEKHSIFINVPIANLPAAYRQSNLFAYKVLELKNGDLLLATIIGLISIRTKNGKYQGYYFGTKNHLISTTTDVIEMEDGTIFAALTNSGLYKLKPTKTDYDTIKSYFYGLDLRSIRKDEERSNTLWIATAIGLIEMNTTTEAYTVWNESKGLANSYVYGSLEDEKHNIWISTNGGLSYLDRVTNHITNYTFQDGLQSNEFNTQAFYKSKTNTFYFGGIKGFNWFRTSNYKQQFNKPQVAIRGVQVNNIPFAKDSALHTGKLIRLPYNSNDLNFDFSVLDFTRPEANRIRYMLKGWDTKWNVSETRSVRYSNLPPGNYTMLVKAYNAGAIWSNEASLPFSIRKPYWSSTWFYILLLLVFVIAIICSTYFVVQQRVKQRLQHLEKEAAIHAERNRISKDMHDEIGNGLTHIALLSQLMQAQHYPGMDVKKDIQAISSSAGKLVQTMSEIIWALSPQNDTLDNLLAYTREQSQQSFEGMNVKLNITFPEVDPSLIITNEKRRNLYLVTKEALMNALKHAKANNIHLSMQIENNQYCFTVNDDGVGLLDNKARIRSNGLKIMKKRMEEIGGTIEWDSCASGTSVKYCLPE